MRSCRVPILLVATLAGVSAFAAEHTPSLQTEVDAAHAAVAAHDAGAVADYVSALASADPSKFGIAIVTVEGEAYTAGDADTTFAIMSAAKPFTLALVIEQHGIDTVMEKITRCAMRRVRP